MNKIYKYSSIANHYRIDDSLLYDKAFYCQHKIDGANFSFVLKPDGVIKGYSRNCIIYEYSMNTNKETIHYGEFFESLKVCRHLISNGFLNNIYNLLKKEYPHYLEYQLVGELYGKGVQHRIEYSNPSCDIWPADIRQYFKCFDIYLIKDEIKTRLDRLENFPDKWANLFIYNEQIKTAIIANDLDIRKYFDKLSIEMANLLNDKYILNRPKIESIDEIDFMEGCVFKQVEGNLTFKYVLPKYREMTNAPSVVIKNGAEEHEDGFYNYLLVACTQERCEKRLRDRPYSSKSDYVTFLDNVLMDILEEYNEMANVCIDKEKLKQAKQPKYKSTLYGFGIQRIRNVYPFDKFIKKLFVNE